MPGLEIETRKLDVLPPSFRYAIVRIEVGDTKAGCKVGYDAWEIPEEVFIECAHLLAQKHSSD